MDKTKEEILKMLKNRRGKYIFVSTSEFHDGKNTSILYCTKKHPDKITTRHGFKMLGIVETKYPLLEPYILLHTKISEAELPFILLNDNSNIEIDTSEIEAYI